MQADGVDQRVKTLSTPDTDIELEQSHRTWVCSAPRRMN